MKLDKGIYEYHQWLHSLENIEIKPIDYSAVDYNMQDIEWTITFTNPREA